MKRTILILAALAAISFQIKAQSMQFLNLQSDPVSLALAGATVAREADGFALQSNAAAMVQDTAKFEAGLAFGGWQPDSKLAGGAFYTRIASKAALGMDIKYSGTQSYLAMDENGAPKDSFSPVDISASLGFAYSITEQLSAGASLFFAKSSLAPENSASAFGANLSLRYTSGAISAGLSLDNLGSKPDYGYGPYSLPAKLKAGAAYKYGGLTALLEADYLFEGAFMAAAAAEYTVHDTVSLRAGYHYGAANAPAIPSYLSTGMGLNVGPVRLNLAYLLASETLSGTWIAGLGLQF